MKRALKIAGYVLGAILLLLVLADVAASFTPEGNAAIFVEDPVMLCVRKPDNDGFTWGNGRWIPCHISKEGLRGPDVPQPRDPKESWVLCIGDSFTFGGGVETAEAWPQQMQGLLGAPEQSAVRVLNGGANGWATGWQRIYLEKRGLDQLRPDVVVLGWNWNDLNVHEGGPEEAVRFFIKAEGSWLHVFADFPRLRDTALYRWLYAHKSGGATIPTDEQLRRSEKVYKATMESYGVEPERKVAELRRNRFGDGPPDENFWLATDTAPWKEVRDEMGRIQALCAARGVAFVVAMLPEPTWEGPGTFPGVDRLAAMLDHLGVPWVDVEPNFLQHKPDGTLQGKKPGLWLRYDPVHPTPDGHKIFADDVAKLLREKGLLGHRAKAQ